MSNSPHRRGGLFVVSAPSGTGKTTIVDEVAARTPGVRRSRSFTSRPARRGETDGDAYHFVSRARFEAMVAGNQFLESAEIVGNLYGTSLFETERQLAAGLDLILVIDVQGARQLRQQGMTAVMIFLMPPSADDLERRLRGRGQDSDEVIARRLEVAREEVPAFAEYHYVVVNDDMTTCVDEVRGIVLAERAKVAMRRERAEAIARSFGIGSDGTA
jgi:guanylate kinase